MHSPSEAKTKPLNPCILSVAKAPVLVPGTRPLSFMQVAQPGQSAVPTSHDIQTSEGTGFSGETCIPPETRVHVGFTVNCTKTLC